MKFIVTSEVTPGEYQKVSDITWPIMAEYCQRHDYEFRGIVVESCERDVIWQRVKSLQEALKECDWAVHIDADCLITNHNIPLTEFIESDKSIVISCAPYKGESIFNDGFFLANSNHRNSQQILKETWDLHRPEDGMFCGQDALWYLYRYGRAEDFSVQPQKRFNSFLWKEYSEPESTPGNWTQGDYILHLPGMTIEKRVELLTRYKEEIIR